MAFTDFLFNGQTPPAVTSTTNTGTSLPLWYSSYLATLANNAASIASQPYQTYNAPRIAPMDPQETQAYNYMGNNATNWESPLQQATGAASGVATNGIDPNSINKYMSPYMGGVTDEISRLGMQNMNENLLPTLNNQFIGAGGQGSDRNRTMDERLVRDVGANISGQQAMALQGGFQQASTLANESAGLQNQGAQNLGNLAQTNQALTTGTAGALSASGATQRGFDQSGLDLAYQDFQNQQNYPRQNVSFLSSVLRGTQVPTSQDQTTTAPFNGTMSASPLSTFAGLTLAGLGIGTGKKSGGYVRLARGGLPVPRGGLSLVSASYPAPTARVPLPIHHRMAAPRGGLESLRAA